MFLFLQPVFCRELCKQFIAWLGGAARRSVQESDTMVNSGRLR